MGIAAFLYVYLAFPWMGGYQVLYGMLPNAVEYSPYIFAHVNGQLLLLLFSALAFTLLLLSGNYPAEKRSVNLDFHAMYRRAAPAFRRVMDRSLNGMNATVSRFTDARLGRAFVFFREKPGWLFVKIQFACYALCAWNSNQLEEKERERYRNSRIGSTTIGIAGLFAIVMFACLFGCSRSQ